MANAKPVTSKPQDAEVQVTDESQMNENVAPASVDDRFKPQVTEREVKGHKYVREDY